MKKNILITLSWPEIEMAAMSGARRHIESRRMRLRGFNKNDARGCKNPWQIEIESSIAEVAVAKVIGQYWGNPVNTFRAPDIDPDIQVRSSQNPNANLIVRPNKDRPDQKFILVTGQAPTYCIIGWIWGHEAMQEKYWRANGLGGRGDPCWLVPQCDLRGFEETTKLEMR